MDSSPGSRCVLVMHLLILKAIFRGSWWSDVALAAVRRSGVWLWRLDHGRWRYPPRVDGLAGAWQAFRSSVSPLILMRGVWARVHLFVGRAD
jgi:hypothetical protein